MSEKKQISFQFKGVKETSFISKISDEITNNFNHDNLQLKLGFTVSGNKEDSIVIIELIVKFKLKVNEKYKEFFSFSTATTFQFNLIDEDLLKIEDSQVYIDDDLMANLLSITIGATRGMMSYKTSGLPFDLVLPIFNIDDIMGDK